MQHFLYRGWANLDCLYNFLMEDHEDLKKHKQGDGFWKACRAFC